MPPRTPGRAGIPAPAGTRPPRRPERRRPAAGRMELPPGQGRTPPSRGTAGPGPSRSRRRPTPARAGTPRLLTAVGGDRTGCHGAYATGEPGRARTPACEAAQDAEVGRRGLALLGTLRNPSATYGCPPVAYGTHVGVMWLHLLQKGYSMSARRKRVMVSVSDEVIALVEQVHQLTGQSRSMVISEILDEVAPAFQATIEALRIVKERPRDAQRLLANFGAEAVGSLMQEQLDFDEKLNALDARTMEGKKARRRHARATK